MRFVPANSVLATRQCRRLSSTRGAIRSVAPYAAVHDVEVGIDAAEVPHASEARAEPLEVIAWP